MYGSYTDYIAFYGDGGLQEVDYRKLDIKAARLMDAYTTGIDGVRKLKAAFPTDPEAVDAVKLCHCEIVHLLWQVDEAEKAAEQSRGMVVTESGVHAKGITSMSAGNESVSFGSGGSSGTATAVEKAIGDKAEQRKMIWDIVKTYLSGIEDANGVNLMFGGAYPCIRTE